MSREFKRWNEQGGSFLPNDRMVLQIAGKDAADYLHRMTTNNVKALGVGAAQETTIIQGDGRMLGYGHLHRTAQDRFLLVCVKAAFEPVQAQLDKFLFREEVELTDVSADCSVIEIIAPRSSMVPELEAPIAEIVESVESKFWINSIFCQMIVRAAQVRDAVSLLERKLLSGTARLHELIRIEQGWPTFGKDCTSATIPLEARLKHAIDFTKGCFPGQEIVARIENLGHPSKLLCGLMIDRDVTMGTSPELQIDGNKVGTITSSIWHPVLKKTVALGIVGWKFKEVGTQLAGSDTDGSSVKAIVSECPFVNRSQ